MILRIIKYITDSTARTVTGLIVIMILANAVVHYARASWDVHNNPQMFLDVNVTPDQTTGIKLSAPQKNGADYTFPTTSGAMLRVRRGNYFEDIYYTSATVNADKTVTLSGVTRNVCAQYGRTIVSCGNGLQLYAGDIVETSVDARNINQKANIDRSNIFSASGAVSFSGSGTLKQPWFSSATERDRQIPSPQFAQVSCLVDTGQCSDYLAGAWRSRSGSNVINASITAAGKSELATPADASGSVITGDSGASTVIPMSLVIRSSTGAINNRNKVVATNNRGYLSGTLLGSGLPTSNKVLYGNQTWSTVSASGASLDINDSVKNATSVFSSTTFSAIDATNLSKTITVSTGSILVLNLVGSYMCNGCNAMDDVMLDFQVGGGNISGTSGALLLSEATGLEATMRYNASFTILHKTLTGGTLTVRPVAKIKGAGAAIRFMRPILFQVVEIFRP